ncbi:MAG: hypothetical protein LBV33_05915 [Lachnospiraceae bacterium]|nr:hypothetical protein [Lachnospiraceae bacterium]
MNFYNRTIVFTVAGFIQGLLFFLILFIEATLDPYAGWGSAILFWIVSCISMELFNFIWREVQIDNSTEPLAPAWGLIVVYTYIYLHAFSLIVIMINLFVKFFRDKSAKTKIVL